MSACSALVSWYSSTSTWSKRSRTRSPAIRIGEQPVPEQQQVVVVEDLLVLLHVGVAREELLEVVLGLAAPGERRLRAPRRSGSLRVDAARVDVEARRLLREARAAAARVRAPCGTRCMRSSESPRSRIVKSGSRPRSRAWMRSSRAATAWKVPPQTRAPESSRTAALGAAAQDAVDAAHHLARGAAREGEQQDAAGIGRRGR